MFSSDSLFRLLLFYDQSVGLTNVSLELGLLDFTIFIMFAKSLKTQYVLQATQANRMIQSLSLYLILRPAKMKFLDQIMKVIQATLPDVLQNLSATSLPLACVSNALNKPRPLRLDASLPSFHDIRWSLARLLYLFNIQLERNVAM